jgi:hypothetical protein
MTAQPYVSAGRGDSGGAGKERRGNMLRKAGYVVVSVAALMLSVPAAYGDNSKKFGFEIEAGPVWQSRNDVRIPK